jgi:hypothetical protein
LAQIKVRKKLSKKITAIEHIEVRARVTDFPGRAVGQTRRASGQGTAVGSHLAIGGFEPI